MNRYALLTALTLALPAQAQTVDDPAKCPAQTVTGDVIIMSIDQQGQHRTRIGSVTRTFDFASNQVCDAFAANTSLGVTITPDRRCLNVTTGQYDVQGFPVAHMADGHSIDLIPPAPERTVRDYGGLVGACMGIKPLEATPS